MLTLSDGGGIYTLGDQPESELLGNWIHDIPSNAGRAESNGMFLDQGTGGFLLFENVIHNVARSPLRFHKGWKNQVQYNVLEVSEGVPPIRYNDTREERIEMKGNKVLDKVPKETVDLARVVAGPGSWKEELLLIGEPERP